MGMKMFIFFLGWFGNMAKQPKPLLGGNNEATEMVKAQNIQVCKYGSQNPCDSSAQKFSAYPVTENSSWKY